jgi:FAD-dependent oxidoreductase family protein
MPQSPLRPPRRVAVAVVAVGALLAGGCSSADESSADDGNFAGKTLTVWFPGRTYVDIDCFPFQIPLGALIPADVDNLVASGKNIGTTHITNGAYRLHPVEWSTGEAVGALADRIAATGLDPAAVRADPQHLRDLQTQLEGLGVTLAWPDHIRTGDWALDHTPVPQRQVEHAHRS